MKRPLKTMKRTQLYGALGEHHSIGKCKGPGVGNEFIYTLEKQPACLEWWAGTQFDEQRDVGGDPESLLRAHCATCAMHCEYKLPVGRGSC